MEFLSTAGPGLAAGDVFTAVAFGIIRVLAYASLGVVLVGAVAASLCDLLECRKWRRCHGRTEFWALMH
jgi:hypothetical protein